MEDWADAMEYSRDREEEEDEFIGREGLPECSVCGKTLEYGERALHLGGSDWLCDDCVESMMEWVDVDWDAVADARERRRRSHA